MKKKYKVCVDDNYHYMQESERYTDGSFNTEEEAVERCREITIESLKHLYERGMKPEELSAQWSIFGEDPFIFGGDGPVRFSARKYITTDLCKEVIEAISAA